MANTLKRIHYKNYLPIDAGLPGSAGASMGQRDELKTQFMTREGLYKLMTLSEYSRPNRYG